VPVRRSAIVRTKQDRYIYPPQRVRLDSDRPLPQRSRDGRRHASIASPRYHLGRVESTRVGIPEEDYVETLPPENPRGGSSQTRPRSRVQDFDHDPVVAGGNRVGVLHRSRHRTGWPKRNCGDGPADHAKDDQRDGEGMTSEFQNRTVGSGNGQPDAMM